MATALIVVLVVGLVLGFGVGRWWAERARALYDMRQVWAGQRRYRE